MDRPCLAQTLTNLPNNNNNNNNNILIGLGLLGSVGHYVIAALQYIFVMLLKHEMGTHTHNH
jgi:hypothetical protein